jgi:hypothetical protein
MKEDSELVSYKSNQNIFHNNVFAENREHRAGNYRGGVFVNGIPFDEWQRRQNLPKPNAIWRALFWLSLGRHRRLYDTAYEMAREYGCLEMSPWRAAKFILSVRG